MTDSSRKRRFRCAGHYTLGAALNCLKLGIEFDGVLPDKVGHLPRVLGPQGYLYLPYAVVTTENGRNLEPEVVGGAAFKQVSLIAHV